MNRVVLALVAIALTSTVLAGCLGGDDVDAAIPTVRVTATPVDGEEDTFLFDGSKSTGVGLDFAWDFGDGTESDEPKTTHTYTHGSGTYTARLTITDANGITDEWSDDIVVGTGENDAPRAAFTPLTRYLKVGEPLTVDAQATMDPEGDPIRYEWDFNFLMRIDDYHAFRDKKANGDGGDDTVEAKSAADPLGELVDKVRGLFYKDLGHGGEPEPPQSMFNGRRTSDEPVYTLEEGFPEATRFYVKLTAFDVKGASEPLISEEIWPVTVVDDKEPEVVSDSITETFDFGAPSTVVDNVDDEDMEFSYTHTWTFEIKRDIEEMYFNVSWTQNPIFEQTGEFPNNVILELIPPKGESHKRTDFNPYSSDREGISIAMNRAQGLGNGEWTAHLIADQGIDIEFTASYWARLDMLHPTLREVEDEFQ